MIRRTIFALLLTVIVSNLSASATSHPSAAVVNHAKQAVVLITTFDTQGHPDKQGSGFFVSPDRIVTNLHVIKSAGEIRIRTLSGRDLLVAAIVATDPKNDLALLQLAAPCPDAAILELAGTEPRSGDPIIVVSNPSGSGWRLTRGEVGDTWHFFGLGERMQITAGILPGSSGGPMLNLQGRVVGIAAMHLPSADDLNFAIPASRLKALQTALVTQNPTPVIRTGAKLSF